MLTYNLKHPLGNNAMTANDHISTDDLKCQYPATIDTKSCHQGDFCLDGEDKFTYLTSPEIPPLLSFNGPFTDNKELN